jgi:hypothetical protein
MKISELLKENYENIPNNKLYLYKNIIDEYIQHGTYIYRGMKNTGKLIKVDASKLNRKAANTENYANILTSYLPSWKGWPARNKSLPMSTNHSQASSYVKAQGGTYIVIPIENQKIGLCRKAQDFWENFPIDVDTLNSVINQILHSVDTMNIPETPEKIISQLDKFLDKINNSDDVAKELGGSKYKVKMVKKLLSLTKNGFPSSALELMDAALDPNYGCSLVNSYKDIPLDHSNELWFSGKMLLIREDLFRELSKI